MLIPVFLCDTRKNNMAEINLVKEFEASLQTCISTLLSQDRTENQLPNQTGLESSIDKFLESARNLEGYFAKFQMNSSVNHPEDAINEDIINLKEELSRKDGLLNSLKDKTTHWNHELDVLVKRQNSVRAIEERTT